SDTRAQRVEPRDLSPRRPHADLVTAVADADRHRLPAVKPARTSAIGLRARAEPARALLGPPAVKAGLTVPATNKQLIDRRIPRRHRDPAHVQVVAVTVATWALDRHEVCRL